MFLGMMQATEYMPNSLLRLLHSTMKKGLLQGAGTRFATWFYVMHRVLWQILRLKFCQSFKNDCIEAAIKDIEEEIFWKSISCLVHAVFFALKGLRYHDSNIPAIDKNYFLKKKAVEALLCSQKVLNDNDLFGSMRGMFLSGCKQALDEVFGETNQERNKSLRYDRFSLKYFFIQV